MISLVLSGGVGSRLWPVSREKLPKQFSPLFKKTLFAQTVERLIKAGSVRVCTGESLKHMTQACLRQEGLSVEKTYFEPVGRNTAPAIALVCYDLMNQGLADEILGVFPSDHWIENESEFHEVLDLAAQCAAEGQVVTLGIKPDHAATGFGYIELEEGSFKEAGSLAAKGVKGFKEKPDLATAESYVSSGRFVWNSGMFVFKVSVMAQAFAAHMPALWKGLNQLQPDFSNLQEVFPSLPSQSIDYGIMEKLSDQVNIPCDIGWSDLGSWDDLALVSPSKLRSGSELLEVQSRGNFFYSDRNKLACLTGVEDLIVVDTADALLVVPKNQSQLVKDTVNALKEKNDMRTTDHEFENRPWGMYRNIYEEPAFKAKVIRVDGMQQLSYQSHGKRSETWIVVEGQGEVVLNEEVISVKPGSVVKIKQGDKHRMRNTHNKPLKFVEVQLGDYFGEDDIVRYEDDYQRD